MSNWLFRFVIVAVVVLGGHTSLLFAQADSVILQAESTFAYAGQTGYTRIMLRSTRILSSVAVPLRLTDTRLIIDSVSTAHSIANPADQAWIFFSETSRRNWVTFMPIPGYEFSSRSGELLRIYWRVRPDAAAGTADVDSFTGTEYLPSGDSVIRHLDASDWDAHTFHCSFTAGHITMLRYACGLIAGGGVPDLSDILYLIDWIFGNGPSPLDSSFGDVDCSGVANVSDAVYLVKYIFDGGPPPCANCP